MAVLAVLFALLVFLRWRYQYWATNGEILTELTEKVQKPSGAKTVYLVKRYPMYPKLSSWLTGSSGWNYFYEVKEGDFVTYTFPIHEDSLDERRAEIRMATPEEKSRAGFAAGSSSLIFSIGGDRKVVFDQGIWNRIPRK